jgi:O-antigen/teichoic acid export membrane protein
MTPSRAAAAFRDVRSTATLTAIGTYLLALATTKLISIAMLPVYTRLLDPSQYGVWELVDFSIQLFALLLSMQLPTATVYHLSLAKDKDKVLSTAIIGAGLVGLLSCFIVFVASRHLSILVFGIPHHTKELQVGSLALLSSSAGAVALAYIRLTNRVHLYVGILFARLGTQIGVTLFLVMVWHKGVLGAIYASVIASFLSSAAAVLSCAPRRGLWFSPRLFWRYVQYGGFLSLGEALAYIISYGDRPLLARNVPLSEVGLYSLAYKGGMLIVYVQRAINLHWSTQMFSMAAQKDNLVRIRRARTRIMFLLIYAAVVLALMSHIAMSVLLSRTFERSSSLVPFILGAYVLRGLAEQLRSHFLLIGATGTDCGINAVSSVICIVCYFWLIPIFGVWGAVIATIASFAVMTVVSYWLLGHERHLSIDIGRICKAAVIGSFVVGIVCWIRPANLMAESAIAICSSACFLVIMLLVACDREDRSEILSLTQMLLRRGGRRQAPGALTAGSHRGAGESANSDLVPGTNCASAIGCDEG